MPVFARPSSFARRACVAALLLAFVLAQTLGWIHRGLHGGGSEGWQQATPVPAAAAHADGGLEDLFGEHVDASDCRLFDVLGQPGCAPAPLVALPVLVPASLLLATHAGFVARWAALFDARGPPASR